MIEVYSDRCLSCRDKALWREIRQYAKNANEIIRTRRTDYDKNARYEAEKLGALPLVVHNGKVVDLTKG